MDGFLWPLLLLLAGLLLVVLELFIPSGGVLSIVAALCAVAAVGLGFFHSLQAGLVVLAITAAAIPAVIVAAIRWWPLTPIGKLILIGRPDDPDDVLPETETFRGLEALVGRRGRSLTKMLPSGVVQIGGKNYDALSEGVPPEEGESIQVVDVRTRRLVVRRAIGTTPQDAQQAEDVLSQPLDSLGIDDWQEPPDSKADPGL